MNECENNLFYFWKGDMVKLRPLEIADSQAIFDEQTDSEADRAFNACIHVARQPSCQWLRQVSCQDAESA